MKLQSLIWAFLTEFCSSCLQVCGDGCHANKYEVLVQLFSCTAKLHALVPNWLLLKHKSTFALSFVS